MQLTQFNSSFQQDQPDYDKSLLYLHNCKVLLHLILIIARCRCATFSICVTSVLFKVIGQVDLLLSIACSLVKAWPWKAAYYATETRSTA